MKIESLISQRPGIYVGILTAIALTSYFLLMKMFGLTHIVELRFLNFLILLVGVFWSMGLQTKNPSERSGYFEMLGNGCMTVLISVSFFSAFIYVYLSCDPSMMLELKHNSTMGDFLTPETAGIGVFAEGFSSGIVMAYVGLLISTGIHQAYDHFIFENYFF